MKRLVIVGCVAALGLLSACGSPSSPTTPPSPTTSSTAAQTRPAVQIDGPSYATVRELAQKADVVVIGKVQKKVATTTEGELSGGAPAGLPIAMWSVAVTKVLKGDPASQISVSRVDTDQVSTDDVTSLKGDQTVLLFLRHGRGDDYNVVGLDQGVFDLTAANAWRERRGEIGQQTTDQVMAGLR